MRIIKYGLGVQIVMVLEILGHFLFKGDGTTPWPHMVMTYIPSDVP
jgi:hypothetical protein